jgi:hypothetical protein
MKRRFRILIWIVLALVLALALTAWLARDWPRRQVQWALARALDAEVELGRLEILSSRIFVLHDLDVRRMRAYPWLEGLRVDRLTVTGGLGEILGNRIESLVLVGAVVTVRESAESAPEAETAPLLVGRLTMESGSLIVRGGGGESRLALAGEITGLGRAPEGELRLRAGRLALVPLLCFAAGSETVSGIVDDSPLDLRQPVEGAEVNVQIGRLDRAAILEARALGGIPFRRPGRPPLAFPDLVLQLDQAPGGGWRFTAKAESPGLASLGLEGGLAAAGDDLQLERVSVVTDDPVLLLFSMGLVPEAVSALGRAEMTLEQAAGAAPLCRITASASRLALPAPVGEGEAARQIRLDSLCPLALEYQGTLVKNADAGNWSTTGRAVISSGPAGTLGAEGTLLVGGGSASGADAAWNWSGPSIAALRRLAAGFGLALPERYRVDGQPRAAGRVSGLLADPAVSGTVEVAGLNLCLESGEEAGCPLGLDSGSLSAGFSFEDRHGLRFSGVRVGGNLTLGPLEPLALTLTAAGRVDPETLRGQVDSLAAELGGLARVAATIRWDPGADPRLTAGIRLEQADLPAIRRAMVPLTGELLPDYELQATVSGGFEAALAPSGGWTAGGIIDLGEAWFASADGARAVQGLASSWQVATEGGPEGSLRVKASTVAGGFQLLWGSVFGDFQEIETQIRLTAGLEVGEGDGGHWRCEGELQPAPGVRLRGSLSGGGVPGRRFTAGLKIDDLAAAFEQCARRPLGSSLPLLEKLDTGGGINAFAEGDLAGEEVALRGRVRLHGLDLTGAEGTMAVKDLDLDLPFDLAWAPSAEGGAGGVDGLPQRGRMGFEELRLDSFTFRRTDSGLVVQGDTVSLEASQSIPLLGGEVVFNRMTLAGLVGEDRRLEAGIVLAGLQLAELSRAMAWPSFEGELAGSLPRVVLSPTRLKVDGGGEISLFGGTVKISDISGEEVLSRYPRLAFSAEFSGIDLARLTRTFDFGEVTGILEGRVSECRLFAGTPVSFQAELMTVPRKGVPQTINVKAINNIAIIGTGGRITIFDRGIHSLLDRYTYEQLGVKMRLEQDMFYLRGTEQRGDRELFLKGRFPFRIDVVNAEPGKTVSFSTMLDRLQSLEFSQATTDSGKGKAQKKR